jgi:hypothetical protein
VGTYEKHDRLSQFDPSLPNPAANGYPGALRFLGKGAGREGNRNLFNNAGGWGPRLGFAYQIADKTVIRAGGGIFYGTNKAPGLGGANNGFTNSPSWSSADLGVKSAFQWDQGFPAWQQPPFIDPGFGAGFSIPWWGADETGKLGTTASWNLAVSRVLPHQFILEGTYTGSKGTHLASERVNIMQIDPKYAYLGSLLNAPIDDPAVVALGFKPPFANFKQLMGGNATLGQSLRVFPQYTGVTTGGMMNHSAIPYNAMILKATNDSREAFAVGELYVVQAADRCRFLRAMDCGVVGSGAGRSAQNQYNRGTEKSYACSIFRT